MEALEKIIPKIDKDIYQIEVKDQISMFPQLLKILEDTYNNIKDLHFSSGSKVCRSEQKDSKFHLPGRVV